MLLSKNQGAALGNTVASKLEANNLKQFLIAPRKLAIAVALALTAGSPLTHAAGLGRLTVQSALGQPLKAEVEITSLSKEEANSLSVRLAPAEAFKQAGLEYNAALGNVKFAVDRRPDGKALVRITSVQPLNEPFVDLLLELNWATGKFVREYTFLLDPPELKLARESTADTPQAAQSPQASPVAPVVAPLPQAATEPAPSPAAASQAAAPAQQSAATAPATEPATRPATAAPGGSAAEVGGGAKRVTKPTPPAARERNVKAAPVAAAPKAEAGAAATSGSVQVKPGDTLAGIAARSKLSDVTLDQAIVAIYRANPSAFFGSVHQLRAGSTLNLPERSSIAAIDATEARTEVRAKSANFAGYKSRLAASAQSVPAAKAGQSASGKVGAKVEDGAQTAAKGDQLKLSRGSSVGEDSAAGKALASKNARAERRVATDVAVKEAQSRVGELEKNVSDLQKLVEMKNKQLADLQKQVDAAKSGASVAGAIAKPDPKAAAKAAAEKAAVEKAEAAEKLASEKAANARIAAEKAAADKAAAQKPAVDKPAVIADVTKSEPKVEAPKAEAPTGEAPKPSEPAKADSASAPADTPKKIAPKPVAAAEGGGFFDDLLGNPLVLPGLGAILALGAGYGWYAMRRRKREEKFEDSLIAADGFTQNSLFGTTGGQSVDTNNSMFTSQRNTAADVHSTEVDPIAEAEVYIAYGREAQAEEILREALKKQPDRQAIRLKLLEIYAGRKDTKAFGTLATDMYSATAGQNEEWPKVVTLGLAIDPENPLYTGKSPLKSAAASESTRMDSSSLPPVSSSPTLSSSAPSGSSAAMPSTVSSAPLNAGGLAASGAMAAGALGAGALGAVASVASQVKSAAASVVAPSIPAAPVAKQVVAEEMPSLDFALDLDAEIDKGKVARATPVSELSKAVEGKFDLPSLDMGSLAGKSATAKKDNLHDDFGGLNIDLPSLERIDSGRSGSDGQGIDLSAIGLDLQPSTMTPPPTADAARWQEMATKLDLASAYEEIGDKEGARELLQEVVKGGDTDQQQKARTMLSKIS
jgi:pilus assembly protein FimV